MSAQAERRARRVIKAKVGEDGMCLLALSHPEKCDCICLGRRHGERYRGKLGKDRWVLTWAAVTNLFVADPDLECPSCSEDLEGLPIVRVRRYAGSTATGGVPDASVLRNRRFVSCDGCGELVEL